METDGTLIERSARGRPDAFVDLVRRHEVAVHGYLARRAGRQAAGDLLGEVWLRAFASRSAFDPAQHDARPWLYGIARNVLRAHWRASRAAGPGARQEAADPWDDVIDRLDSAVRVRALAGAVRAPPPEEREVLLLVAWEQLTPAQAATALGIPPATPRPTGRAARPSAAPAIRTSETPEATPARQLNICLELAARRLEGL